MIRYLKGYEIDRKKWDACVQRSSANLIYGFSWYLDLVCPGWDGLVMGEYEAVMPLPVRRKYGITYIFQPVFAQQLGIFSTFNVDNILLNEFISAIPTTVKFIEFNLNYSNLILNSEYSFTKKVNYELKLNRSYAALKNGYSNNTRRNIQRTLLDTEVKEGVSLTELIRMKKDNPFKKRNAGFYEWMYLFADKLIKMGKGEIIGTESDGKLCAAALFLVFGKRIYYLIPVSTEKGKENRAMFAILDHIIQKFGGNDLVLDFEGSNIRGIARFFEGFGAREVIYHTIKINRLPFVFKLFKR